MDTILEPVGTCPITGYPLVAVHETTGTHAGLALAALEDAAHRHDPDADPDLRPLSLTEVATYSEVFRSWSELLIFAIAERTRTGSLLSAEKDYEQCRDLLRTRHHYDPVRIIASIHITAVEYLRTNIPWAAPELVLVPDVGVEHVATAAQTVVRRLAGSAEAIPDTVNQLRGTYLDHLAAVA